ncbi:hypothetical protein KC19_7G029200 [Ceratodon purpureus]|uniref:Uncharacterized protein n=1 Tax=Ceratodon purpureus TaxID=3225 RepID=A0A8T0H5E1_CERPU|nr:hypothetical protein KC19_7G029200 [Ceratodon purpureus]KAG0565985.1 hypothetical protein KC19_7G029200 [Ceratodon purpureus]KAG0565986.1 hypothetical protein KC19_7G029200 [Ceratodon purpureus]
MMARSDDLGKGETSPKRPGSMENSVKSDRAEKKPRLSKLNSKSSRKRAWSEVEETDIGLEESEDPSTSRKIIRVGSTKKNDGEGDKLVERYGSRESKESESNIEESGSKLGKMKPQLSLRKWKRMSRCADTGGLEHDDGSSARSSRVDEEKIGKQKEIREHEVVRKVLQTVHLEESCGAGDNETVADREDDSIGLEKDSDGTVSSLKQSGRDKKRRGSGKADAKQPEKKLRIDDAVAEPSSRGAEQGVGVGIDNIGTWRRLKGQKPKPRPAASEDMGVSVSEAWKRLREEKDTGTSGSSVNGRSDSDLSMHSSDSELELEERAKKARYDLPLPPQGKKWTRKSREKKESSSSKRLREGGLESSGSSGSDISYSSYYHNRKWKRPRFEYMMSMQGRSWRKQARDVDDARVSCRENDRKRVQVDASEKPAKRQRK